MKPKRRSSPLLFSLLTRAGIQMEQAQLEVLLGLTVEPNILEHNTATNPKTSSQDEVYVSYQQIVSVLEGGGTKRM